jgi:hypothetical protein
MKTEASLPRQSAVVDGLLDSFARSLTPAAARVLVDFRADPATVARVARLAEKCNEGELTAKERDDYEAYVRAADLIAILQSKARRLLKAKKS